LEQEIYKKSEVLGEIVEKYGKMVSSLCNRIIYDKELVEDAVQEVWIEVFNSISEFKGQSKLSTWIYTITYRVVINYSQKQKKYSTKFLKECFDENNLMYSINPIDHVEEIMEVKEMCNKCLTGILHCFDSETKMLYVFRDVAELSYKELSEIFKTDEASIRQRISRARRKLRNFLNNECMLFNDNGKCRCKIKNKVDEINLAEEYKKIRSINNKITVIKQFEKVIPQKNYWEEFFMSQKVGRSN
jgi:RNA polymerase sigma-70 factor (ECF subfamily)